MAGSDGSLSSI